MSIAGRMTAASLAISALLVGTASVRAAPAGRAAPVEGLRDCPNGGFSLPGSQTCLRLGGSVRADATVRTGSAIAGTRHAVTRLGSSARIDLDLRTPTEMGPLRVFTSVRARSSGAPLR